MGGSRNGEKGGGGKPVRVQASWPNFGEGRNRVRVHLAGLHGVESLGAH